MVGIDFRIPQRFPLTEHSGLWLEKSKRIVISAKVDEMIWEFGKTTPIRTVTHYFNVILLHELTHWAGEEDAEDDWIWNMTLERIILGQRLHFARQHKETKDIQEA